MTVRSTQFANSRYTYSLPWSGEKFPSSKTNPIAFDTETEVVDVGTPKAVLATISTGTRSAVLSLQQLPSFIQQHAGSYLVGHNFAFDFWVVERYLRESDHREALGIWWSLVDRGHVFDTMVLDMLVRIARGEGAKGGAEDGIWARNLDEVAQSYAKIAVNKEDPYRMRYAEILGKPFEEVTDVGFFDYAIKDAIATARTYNAMRAVADSLVRTHALFYPPEKREYRSDVVEKYGLLTETLQVKASVTLKYMEDRGICVDNQKVATLDKTYRDHVDDVIEFMRCRWPDLFKYQKPKKVKQPKVEKVKLPRKKKGDPPREKPAKPAPPPIPPREELPLELTKKSGLPSLNSKWLKEYLQQLADELEVDAPQSDGKKKGISASVKAWSELAKEYGASHPFLQAWPLVAESSKLLGFLSIAAKDKVLRPRYGLLKLTGRTSCYSPNLQQWPKLAAFREIFIPRSGFKLLTIDYSAIELCTLASVCQKRFGYSKLGELIRNKKDPHAYTASMILGVPLEDFMLLKKSDEKFFKAKRQAAKALNFGCPGGLGALKLSLYAKANYGVDLTVEEAQAFREKLINQIYPELNDKDGFLADECWTNMAFSLGLSEEILRKAFDAEDPDKGFITGRALGKVIRGSPVKFDGTPYKPEFVERMWHSIISVFTLSPKVKSEDLEQLFEKKGSPQLFYKYCAGVVPTLTGRLRGGVDYTQQKNCLDAETEALTRRGWVKGFDLKMDDQLLTKNADTGELEWQHPTDLKFYPDYEGPLVEFSSKSMSAVSTPDHRWLVTDKTTGKDVCKLTSEISPAGHHTIHRTGKYFGSYVECFSNDFVELAGWFLTDGSCSLIPRKRVQHQPRVILCQSERGNPEKVKRIEDLILRMDILSSKYRQSQGGVVWYLKSSMAKKLHTLFPNRTLTPDFLLSLKKEQLHLLLNTMIDGDGCRSGGEITFACKEKERSDMFQFLCTLCGYASKATWRDMSMYTPRSPKINNIPNMTGYWYVRVLKRDKAQITVSQRREFTDKRPIWCPMVPNTYFVARRNEKVYITGNTRFQALAADGIKLAMWRLLSEGFNIVAMIHDELVVELESSRADILAERVQKLMQDSMSEVLGHTVPISTEFHVADCWTK